MKYFQILLASSLIFSSTANADPTVKINVTEKQYYKVSSTLTDFAKNIPFYRQGNYLTKNGYVYNQSIIQMFNVPNSITETVIKTTIDRDKLNWGAEKGAKSGHSGIQADATYDAGRTDLNSPPKISSTQRSQSDSDFREFRKFHKKY